jgi:hypothetical protein
MAKKEKAVMAAEEPVMASPLKKENKTLKWERKDRQYFLKGSKQPIILLLKSKGIMWYDEEKGFEREITNTINQKTPFVDEFVGPARLDQIIFRDGVLTVPKEKTILQQILSIYHPDKGRIYEELDNEAVAEDDLDILNLEFEAMSAAMQLDVDHAEAIVRTEVGSKVSNMTSKELKRDLLVMARNNPVLFLELVNDDNINIRNLGIKATEVGIIKLSNDQRTFTWGSTNRKLLTVPFDENPYSALAAWFKTDEGVEVYQTIEKRLK